MVKKDCWQSISAPGEDVGTLDLVAEPFWRVEMVFSPGCVADCLNGFAWFEMSPIS